MAKIVDPDLLNQGTEIIFDTANRTVELVVAGNLSNDGVALQCVYSFSKEEWKSDNALNNIPFPLKPIDGPSGTQFDLIYGWSWKNVVTTGLIRDGGWAMRDGAGASQEEWMNLTSLGAFDNSNADQAYYTQGDIDSPTDIDLTGEVNQAIQVFGDATHGDFDYRGDFIIFLREEAKKYDSYDLIVEQGISALTYKKYALPLSNEPDLKVTHDDATVGGAAYANVDITYHTVNQDRIVGGVTKHFRKIIEGDNLTLEQIYEKVMYLERQTTDIDEGTGAVRGDTSDTLIYFVGSELYCKNSVFIDNIQSADLNRIYFIDEEGNDVSYPYASAGKIAFNPALQNDTDAFFQMYFKNDDDGDNLGADYGTDNAVIVKDKDGANISGDIGGLLEKNFSYDYDGNVQRGAASAGVDAPVVIVGMGLGTGQFVIAEITIGRSKTNNASLVANDELTYSNPA